MKISELIKKIEKDYPLSNALEFDNAGLNILSYDDNVSGIIICLDITLDAIEYAKKIGANLIISHHPLIFTPIKNISNDMVSLRIKKLLSYGINTYSMHTNFDVSIKNGMGKLFIDILFKHSEIKEHTYLVAYSKSTAIGDIITLKKYISFNELKNRVFNAFSVSNNYSAYYDFAKKPIKKIIVLPGAGSSETNLVIDNKCDCYISSDLKHNNIIDLFDAKISYINPTHFSMENIFVPYINKYIKKLTKYKNIYSYNVL